MEREIIFRGKELGIRDWAYGDLTNLEIDGKEYAKIGRFYVDPSTVGQYTGLTDRNGVKIFEGDIVNHRLMLHETMRTGIVEYSDNYGAFFIVGSGYSDNQMYAFCDFEIIGNRWDKPELLEVKK